MFSVIITSHNEGTILHETIASIRETATDCEIILVDDGSDDGSCETADADRFVRNDDRTGIAYGRCVGAEAATTECYIFCDAHHLFSPGCLDGIASVAMEYQAIVWPCIRGMLDGRWNPRSHGAYLALAADDKRAGMVGVSWLRKTVGERITRSSGLFVPYAIPAAIFPRVRWPNGMRDFGQSEMSLVTKAFFADVDILHLCGPFARHKFRRKQPYRASGWMYAANHAIVCRVCFTLATWEQYWFPKVFARRFDRAEFDKAWMLCEQAEFASRYKQRPDSEFWRGLLDAPVPDGVSDA